MADIKDEISFIGKLLRKGKKGHPTRFILFIDDLDRCQHQKAVEVMQAIMLLLTDEDGSPFVIFLGIDARVVVRAIEESYGDVLVKAGINGYEYLDKIVQVPFVIPLARQAEINTYVESLLSPEEEPKTTAEKLMPQAEAEPTQATQPLTKDQSVSDQPTSNDVSEPQAATLLDALETNQETKRETELRASPEQLIPVEFTQSERGALRACAADLIDNPRKIKRIINIYRLARLIMPSSIQSYQAIRWILITEQWPLHAAWIIQYIENDAKMKNKFVDKSIVEVFKAAKNDIHSAAMERLLEVDAAPHLFEQFIKKRPIFSVTEIKALLPLTFNLNPAIRSEVRKQSIKSAMIKPKSKPRHKLSKRKSTLIRSSEKGNGVTPISHVQEPK
jgi:hypothetical protein